MQNMLSAISRAIFRCPYKVTSPASLTIMRHSSTTSLPSQEEGTWLHKLSEAEKMFVYGARVGTRLGVQAFTLNSRKPLSPDVVLQASKHLQRKCPTFQLAIRERDGEMWCYKPKDMPDIDFKVYEKGTSELEIMYDVVRPFDEANGSLWRVGFASADEDHKCRLPDIEKEYPHAYHLVLCPHHSVFDGMTSVFQFLSMMDILNAVIEGENISSSPIGEFVSSEEYQRLFSKTHEELLNDPQRLELLKKEVIKADKTPILFKAFPRPPNVDNPKSKFMFVDIEQDVLQKFIDKCKQNGVTYGNAFQTVTNTAYIELVQEAGVNDDYYDISVKYSTDMRRYMKKRELPILGMHARIMSSCMTFDKNVRDNFWSNCRMAQQINKDLIKTMGPFGEDVVRTLFLPKTSPEEFFLSKPQLTHDYGYNSVGVIPMHGPGKHVQTTGIHNYTVSHLFTYPFSSQILSYRGNFDFTICYYTDGMTDETATLLVNKIKSVVKYFYEK